MFVKYQHVEKFGSEACEGIQFGECYVFPKIDGTNSSVWYDAGLMCGSRNHELTETHDNAGFRAFVVSSDKLNRFFMEHKNLRLYGEWLVPHSLKTYRESAWRDFYVFDVMDGDNYLPYNEYKVLLEKFNINYIPPIAILQNGSDEQFFKCLENNKYLIPDNMGVGEGIVIKRYDFKNKYGRTVWAKIVTSEFKEKHYKEMGSPEIKGELTPEVRFVDEYCTEAFIKKEYSKIAVDGFNSRKIPQLLSTVFYSLVCEHTWDFVKKHKFPRLDFKRANMLCVEKIKLTLPELFNQ